MLHGKRERSDKQHLMNDNKTNNTIIILKLILVLKNVFLHELPVIVILLHTLNYIFSVI